MAVFLAAGACMLAMKIPQDYAWHSIAVEAVLNVVICLEAVMLVFNKVRDQSRAYVYIACMRYEILYFYSCLLVAQMSEDGGTENLLRDLIMTSVETFINYWLFADYLVITHSPWDAQSILHLVRSHAWLHSCPRSVRLHRSHLMTYQQYGTESFSFIHRWVALWPC